MRTYLLVKCMRKNRHKCSPRYSLFAVLFVSVRVIPSVFDTIQTEPDLCVSLPSSWFDFTSKNWL